MSRTEHAKPFAEHATSEVAFVDDWLAGKLYGIARNAAPDLGEKNDRRCLICGVKQQRR